MPITIRKIELFCSLLFFSPTSLQRAKNACFSLIFPEKSAFRNGFELRRSDVKKDFFFNIFRRRSVESSSDNFRFFPTNTVSFDIYQKTRNQFGSNATWVRIPPSAPRAAPCGVLLFIFAANYASAARWDSNSPCPALCVPPGCNSPADCCKGAGESHRLRQKQHPAGCCFLFLRQTMQGLQGGIRTARARRFASRRAATVLRTVARARENPTVCAKYHYSISHWVVIFYCHFVKSPYFSYKHLPFIFK